LIVNIVLPVTGRISLFEDISWNNKYNKSFEINKLIFSEPVIKKNNVDCIELHLKNNHEYLAIPGRPLIPKIVEKFELPFGVKDINVEVKVNKVNEQKISNEIITTPNPVILNYDKNDLKIFETNDHVDSSYELFPKEWFSYNVGVGLNNDFERVTYLTIHIYPVRYKPLDNILFYTENFDIKIYYNEPEKPFYPLNNEYDLLIIAPEEFSEDLQRLVEHKNNHGVNTLLKFTGEIYSEIDGRDKPEKIKLFIKDSIEQFNIKYVLLVGGLKSLIYAKPKDDMNQGSSAWYVPVRYSNTRELEPGYLCDLYYADIYKENGVFDDWDSNGNDIFAEWKDFNPDVLDLYPDVAVGRLACRNNIEVKDVVDKIIKYESTSADPSWFNRIIGVTGDSFLDQVDLDFKWDINELSDGDYTIYAQSTNDEDESGPIDITNVVLDRNSGTILTFNHDDNLLVDSYPAPPIAEVVSVSEGNIIGNTDYIYHPSENEAYCNDFYGWGNIEYIDGILAIRGKSYDPKLYGNITDIHVWIENSEGETVFDDWRYGTKMFSEGDWIVGEKYIHGRGGSMYYMPNDFDKIIISTSNGLFNGIPDVITALSQGSGFVIFSVHGSPGSLGNHLPGIPGNRHGSYRNGMAVNTLKPYFPYVTRPILPINEISNIDKLPIAVISLGCHCSNFNVSLVNSFLDLYKPLSMHTYGHPISECLGWYFVKLPETGAIATIGYSDYGLGNLGEWFTIAGLDGWISTEFFRQYGEEDNQILGMAHSQSISNYITHFKDFIFPEWEDYGWDQYDEMTVEGWTLLGDPSLKIGGYS
jgi:hypothetical protein